MIIRAEIGKPLALKTAVGLLKNWDGHKLTCASGHDIPHEETGWKNNQSGYKLFMEVNVNNGTMWNQVLPPLKK